MNLLQDLINAGKGAVRAAGAPVHAAEQIGQQVAQELTHAGGPVAGAMQGGAAGAGVGGLLQALGGQNPTKIPYNNGFYAGPYDPSRQLPQAPQNPTKIPWKNGFYAGPYNPNYIMPNPDGSLPMGNVGQMAAPSLTPLQNGMQGGQYNPGYTPMQGSRGVGPMQGGQDVYWQNTDGVRRNMVNPQVSDNGYFYN